MPSDTYSSSTELLILKFRIIMKKIFFICFCTCMFVFFSCGHKQKKVSEKFLSEQQQETFAAWGEWKVKSVTFKDKELSLRSPETMDTSGLLSGKKQVKMSKYDIALLFLPLLKEKYTRMKEVYLSKNAITFRIPENPDSSGEWKTEVWEFQSMVRAGSNKYFLIQNTKNEESDSAYLIISDKNILLGNHVMEINLVK